MCRQVAHCSNFMRPLRSKRRSSAHQLGAGLSGLCVALQPELDIRATRSDNYAANAKNSVDFRKSSAQATQF